MYVFADVIILTTFERHFLTSQFQIVDGKLEAPVYSTFFSTHSENDKLIYTYTYIIYNTVHNIKMLQIHRPTIKDGHLDVIHYTAL